MSVNQNKIHQALLYIKKNLSKKILWDDVSRHCGVSRFHFHRLFTAQMKETPGDLLKRLRLERAAALLVMKENISISEVALECGYSSQANLSKAFKIHFGVTPREVQRALAPKNSNIGKNKSKYGKDFKIDELYPIAEIVASIKEALMNVEIKKISERRVIYSTSPQGYTKDSIENTWKGLIGNAMTLLSMKRDEIVTMGLGYDNPQVTPENKCRYDACIVVEGSQKVGDNFQIQKFPSGNYACFHFKGKKTDLTQFYLNIYSNWFSSNKYEPGDFPLIENYLDINLADGEIELEAQFLLKD